MVKRRRMSRAPSGETAIIIKSWRISERNLKARKRELLKAGFLEKITLGGETFNEITRLDGDYEVGLLSFSIKELNKTRIIPGRKRHIKFIMKQYPDMSYEEAKRLAVRDIWETGGIPGRLDDYIEYYYERYR